MEDNRIMKKLALMGLAAAPLLVSFAALANPTAETSKGPSQIKVAPAKSKATGAVKGGTKSNKSTTYKGTPVNRYNLENAWPSK